MINNKTKMNNDFMNNKKAFLVSKCLLVIFLIIIPGTFIPLVNLIGNTDNIKWTIDFYSKMTINNLLSMVVTSLQISFPIIFIIILSKESFKEYGFNKISKKDLALSILRQLLSFIGIMVVIGIVIIVIQYIFKLNLINDTTKFNIEIRKSNIFLFILSIIPLFLGAFTEELCFRSYFYNNINKIIQNKWVCIIITNLLFSSGHIYQGIYGCIYSFILGMVMNIEYKNRNNIYTIIIFHMITNVYAFAIGLLL
jgi:membrane protease YdiL (CAAX protease family)